MHGTHHTANIGPKESGRRRKLGFYALAFGIAAAVFLVLADVPRWTRLAVFFPFWTAALGLLQAREKV